MVDITIFKLVILATIIMGINDVGLYLILFAGLQKKLHDKYDKTDRILSIIVGVILILGSIATLSIAMDYCKK